MSAQPGVGTVLPWELSNNAPGPAPYTITIPASLEVQPYTSTATYDGTDADGDFVPTLSIYSQTGALLARVFPAATVKAGDTATVTYLPPFGSAAVTEPPSSSGWTFDTDPQAGGWGVLSMDGVDPTEFASDAVTGNFTFRIDTQQDTVNGGILLVVVGTGDFVDQNAYMLLVPGQAGFVASQEVGFNAPITYLYSGRVNMPNIPTSNVELNPNDVYRDGVGPDSPLMIV